MKLYLLGLEYGFVVNVNLRTRFDEYRLNYVRSAVGSQKIKKNGSRVCYRIININVTRLGLS